MTKKCPHASLVRRASAESAGLEGEGGRGRAREGEGGRGFHWGRIVRKEAFEWEHEDGRIFFEDHMIQMIIFFILA